MMNLKFIEKLFILLFLGFSLCAVQACDDDEKLEENTLDLIGVWEHSYNEGYDLYQFNNDGTGKGVTSEGVNWTFKYDLNDKASKLVYTKENELAEIWNIEPISSSSIKINGEWILSKTNKKIEDIKTLGIVGSWCYEFSSGYVYMYFSETGYGWQHEYDENDGGWYDKEHFNYTYLHTSKKIIFEWNDGDTEEISIWDLSNSKLILRDFLDEGLGTWNRVSDGEYKTSDDIEQEKPETTKKLVRILKEKTKRYDSDSPLNKYAYIYEFNYNNEGFLSSAKMYDDEGYSEVINYEYSENKIYNGKVSYSLFNDKVSIYENEYDYYKFDYGSSNYEQLNKIGENGEYIVSWENNRITKVGENSVSDYYLPFQTYYWYNTYTYEGKTCNGFIDIGILGFSDIFNLDDGKMMSDIIMLVHPELFGLKTNQLPKSSKEEIYVEDYDEDTGEEIIYDDYESYTYTYEFDDDGYLKKVTKTNVNATDEFISNTYTWE